MRAFLPVPSPPRTGIRPEVRIEGIGDSVPPAALAPAQRQPHGPPTIRSCPTDQLNPQKPVRVSEADTLRAVAGRSDLWLEGVVFSPVWAFDYGSVYGSVTATMTSESLAWIRRQMVEATEDERQQARADADVRVYQRWAARGARDVEACHGYRYARSLPRLRITFRDGNA